MDRFLDAYPLSRIFWYRPIFMAMLVIAISLFSYRLKKRSAFPLRVLVSILLVLEISFLFPLLTENTFYLTGMFVVFWLVSFLFMHFCFKENTKNLLFLSVMGYTTEHIAYELYSFLITAFNVNGTTQSVYSFTSRNVFANVTDGICYFASYIIVYAAVYFLFARKVKGNEGVSVRNPIIILVSFVFVFIDIFINSYLDSYSQTAFDKTYVLMITAVNILLCVMFMFFSFENALRQEIRKNYDIISQMKYNEAKQYELSKENIDLINRKCHDLKYFIKAFKKDEKVSPELIDEISNAIEIFDSNIKTGNPALDIIFREKSLLCQQKGIRFTCIAEGELLSFMEDVDAYALFGNLIDNAIEALNEEKEKRIIRLVIKGQGELVSISIQNHCSKVIKFRDGLPLTTKKDKKYHGFGMQSVKMICDKYKGILTINTDNNIFKISILF